MKFIENIINSFRLKGYEKKAYSYGNELHIKKVDDLVKKNKDCSVTLEFNNGSIATLTAGIPAHKFVKKSQKTINRELYKTITSKIDDCKNLTQEERIFYRLYRSHTKIPSYVFHKVMNPSIGQYTRAIHNLRHVYGVDIENEIDYVVENNANVRRGFYWIKDENK